ncbi:DNase/tRNase domain of colicin-like bacteriocin [Pontibacillus halophilus JSM 076056 = DSM 19796]|uniref:DNase/tRNase domain of colicin-like bacteriocin n=1 Tax=Pontibacillus halophilus JSM 076056 = DSM 19796 TaxID=1385510 RepID=A0A0A5GDY8_9BACI|nr:HNH endonuclease [Pontibacillus halophilus]KGX90209.1 DNase/tRNase domain of colicin-like bacteriocin [Pontibacillus halophilus JSM 076056 = DSM 19796]
MAFIRHIGKGIGTVGGGLVGGAVKLAGKAVGTKNENIGQWMEDTGSTIKTASETALDNAGQFLDGAVQGTYGVITREEKHRQAGWSDVKDSSTRTLKGVGATAKYTWNSAGTTYNGIINKDNDMIIDGVKNLGKVAAVSTMAIGVIDLMDGSTVEAETINDHLVDGEHPETGVPFQEKTITLPNGDEVVGTYPVFESNYSAILPQEVYLESDDIHFRMANDSLYEAIQQNPNLASQMGMNVEDVNRLAVGDTPEGYTWHHNETPGVMQLVDEDVHENTGHTGGRVMWGGGSENR